MAAEHILRASPGEGESNSVMINVKSNGPKSLDLALLATDGDSAWEASIKHSRVSKLRSKNSPVSDTEWEDILSTLLLKPDNDKNRPTPKPPEKLELSSLIVSDRLTVIVRRNISGITQRLGEIVLQVLDEEEAGDRVELLDWVGVAVDRFTALEEDIQNMNAKYDEQERTIERLHRQLEDFVEAKKEHEASLLGKFQELLNAKKLKIRDQQRLLAGAKVNHHEAAQIQAIRQADSPRLPRSSRATKRKANGGSPLKAKSESDEDTMVDRVPSEGPENHDEETPPHSDVDATEDESENEQMGPAPPPAPRSKGRLLENRDEQSAPSPPHKSQPLVLPPRGELPFTKQTAPRDNPATSVKPASMESSHNANLDGSETSDDEL